MSMAVFDICAGKPGQGWVRGRGGSGAGGSVSDGTGARGASACGTGMVHVVAEDVCRDPPPPPRARRRRPPNGPPAARRRPPPPGKGATIPPKAPKVSGFRIKEP